MDPTQLHASITMRVKTIGIHKIDPVLYEYQLQLLLLVKAPITGYPPIFRIFLTPPQTLRHLSFSLIVSKYFNLYKTFLLTYDEGCQGVVVLSIIQGKLKQFSMRYLFRKDKTVYYKVKVLMVNRITRNMLFFWPGKM